MVNHSTVPPLVALKYRILTAILILGAYSQIVQAVLIREGLVVFYGNEVSLGAFYGSWLFWIALGSVAVLRLRERRWIRAALSSLRLLLLLLPLLAVVQVLALRSVRLLLDVSSSEFVPLGGLFASVFLITIPSGLVLGAAFPLACRALHEEEGAGSGAAVSLVSRLYVADALGALAGGVLFTFVLLQWLGLVQTLGLVTLVLGGAAWSLGPARAGTGWVALLFAGVGLILALTPVAPRLEKILEEHRFSALQPDLELVDAVDTRYGHQVVAKLGAQVSVVVDGQIRESFPLPREVQREAAYLYSQGVGAKRLLLFGGFASGLATELLRYPVEGIDLVEQDRRAFERVRPFLPPSTAQSLEDPRLTLHFQDGRRFLSRSSAAAGYDLVLLLNAAPSNAYSNRYFTRDFYRALRGHLSPRGVFCTQVSGASNYMGLAVGSYAGSVYHTLRDTFPYIAILPGDQLVFCASSAAEQLSEEPEVLERRYLSTPLEERRFPAASFYSMLSAQDISYARERFEEIGGEINRDDRPVTYYLNMVLWGKLSASRFVDWLERLRAMGAWPYVLPLVLFLLLWLARTAMERPRRQAMQRQSANLVLWVLGLIAMAAQLCVLFSYQSHVGFMFERIALLNGLFMTGLALGAALGKRWARGAWTGLVSVVILTALGAYLLPVALGILGVDMSAWQEPGYLSLALMVGSITGMGYPLAVQLAHQDLGEVLSSGAATQAADNLGGALGGLISGALMVPLLGVEGTCRVLSVLALLALVPLFFARLAPASPVGPRGRGVPSLPWPGLGWWLLYCVLLVYGWHLLAQGAAPEARVRFDEQRLAQVSGSARFDLREEPFVHYLGRAAVGEGVETGVTSSMAVAPEVKGFAGPINLLLAVDEEGTLHAVRYIESEETPAYIQGIERWLSGLDGTDLNSGPLTLDQVDGLSGATVSSRAALRAINLSARRLTDAVFGRRVPASAGPSGGSLDLEFYATLALLLAFFPIYLSGSERARLGFQLAALAVLGLWLNTLVTEVDLINLSLGHAAPPADNPQRWLLLGFVGVTGLLFGQVWCGYVCPFGALQELASRLGRRLGVRSYPDRRLEQRIRWLKYLLLTLMVVLVWGGGETFWASFDPMQHIFGAQMAVPMLFLVLVVLLGCLFYVRFWCRYFCPMGALLSLTNKLALLQRLAPPRRFEHCDLGVRHEFDLDCIRCNRCLTAADTRVRRSHTEHRTG